MNPPNCYRTPEAYRSALDEALRRRAQETREPFFRQRQLFVFGRFLARVVQEFDQAITLKGGLALELRLEQARTTKDVDFRFTGTPDEILERLQACGRLELGDRLGFQVLVDADHPEITGDGAKYGGRRFRTTCILGGKTFADPFGVDVAIGGPMFREPDVLPVDGLLGLPGLSSPPLRVLAVETHIAEKLHAYSYRDRASSRVKDLPDLVLLARTKGLMAMDVHAAIVQTFEARATHAVPATFPDPPSGWERPYARLAQEHGLEWATLAAVTQAARGFLGPVLAGAAGLWDSETQEWKAI